MPKYMKSNNSLWFVSIDADERQPGAGRIYNIDASFEKTNYIILNKGDQNE